MRNCPLRLCAAVLNGAVVFLLIRYPAMIKLHRLNGQEFVLNAELVETIDTVPDTVINLVTGNRFVVREPADTVYRLVVEYKQCVARPAAGMASPTGPARKS